MNNQYYVNVYATIRLHVLMFFCLINFVLDILMIGCLGNNFFSVDQERKKRVCHKFIYLKMVRKRKKSVKERKYNNRSDESVGSTLKIFHSPFS